MAAGHPRALHQGLEYLQQHNALMPVSELAIQLRANTIGVSVIEPLIRHSFEPKEMELLPVPLQQAAERGSLRYAPTADTSKGWLSAPLPLIGAAIYNSKVTNQVPYSFIWKLMQPASPNAPKQFEECIHQFDLIKSFYGLPVVPPNLAVIPPFEHGRELRGPKAPRLAPRDWHELEYSFKAHSNENVLKNSPTEGVTFREEFKEKLDSELYVYCAQEAETHPCFDAMYDAKFPSDGTRVKVLLHTRIHDNLQSAIEGLEMAAQLLTKAGWVGTFLFVILLGEVITPPTTCNHSLLLIQKKDYNYFLPPTFTPIVEMQRFFRHQAPNAKKTTSERYLGK